MDFRVTLPTMINRVLVQNRRNTDRLALFQQQALAGKQLLQPSDDPAGTVILRSNEIRVEQINVHLANIQQARSTLNASVSSLTELSTLLVKAKDIALEGANTGIDNSAFATLAADVDRLAERALNIANTRHQGRFLYAGTAAGNAPFAYNQLTGRVEYAGSEQFATTVISPGKTVATLLSGQDIFQARQRGATVFTGDTGAASGTGTDSATGQGTLLVQHTSTSYAAGSGVQPGTNSVAGDTILGPAGAHQLTIVDTSGTGASGTVSLNGGPAIAFSSTDANLKVAGPGGEVVFVDTTAITAGFNGAVAITADGVLSVDGGATAVTIDFSANQIVTHGATGEVTHVDSSNIRAAGAEHVNYQGTYDVFQILQALSDDLRNTRNLPENEQLDSIGERISELDRLREGILQVIGEQSASLKNLDGVEGRLESVRLELSTVNAELEGADITTIILNLQAQENQLQLVQAVTLRLFDQSLVDFLR